MHPHRYKWHVYTDNKSGLSVPGRQWHMLVFFRVVQRGIDDEFVWVPQLGAPFEGHEHEDGVRRKQILGFTANQRFAH